MRPKYQQKAEQERDAAVKRVKELEAGLDSYWKDHDETLADQLVAIKARYDQLEGERRAAVAELDAALAERDKFLAQRNELISDQCEEDTEIRKLLAAYDKSDSLARDPLSDLVERAIADLDAARKRVKELETGLRSIAAWDMPTTGDGKPYGWHWGSNGEQRVIRNRAAALLAAKE